MGDGEAGDTLGRGVGDAACGVALGEGDGEGRVAESAGEAVGEDEDGGATVDEGDMDSGAVGEGWTAS